jgi:hypothetical protein
MRSAPARLSELDTWVLDFEFFFEIHVHIPLDAVGVQE